MQKNNNVHKINSSSSSSDDCEMLDVSEKSCRSESLISVDEEAVQGEDTLEISEGMQESHLESPRIKRKPKVSISAKMTFNKLIFFVVYGQRKEN